MKKMIFISMILLSLFMGCGKDEDSQAKVRIVCESSNPYSVTFDGNTSTLSGNTFKDFTVSPGVHYVSYMQLSGYVLYPTSGTFDITVVAGDNVEYSIP